MAKRKYKTTTLTATKSKISAVDLFCGVGGLTKGLEKAGIDVKLGIDIDPACEYPYSANNSRFLLRIASDFWQVVHLVRHSLHIIKKRRKQILRINAGGYWESLVGS
jgi:site-specific DNA-cytosine methylase